MSPDDPLFAEFLAESAEHLDVLDAGLGGDAGVDVLFRAMHSLKGMASAIGARGMAELAHGAEDLLSQARSGRLALSPPARSALLAATDGLRLAREALAEGRERPAEPALMARLAAFGVAAPAPSQAAAAPIVMAGDPLRATLASRLAVEMPVFDAHRAGALAEAARSAGLPRLGEALAAAAVPAGFGRLRVKLALLEQVTGVPAGSVVTLPGQPDPAPLLAAFGTAALADAACDYADAAHAHGDAGAEALGRQIQDFARQGDAALLDGALSEFSLALEAPQPAPVTRAASAPPPPLTASLAAALPSVAHMRAAAAMAAGQRIWRLRLGALVSAEAVVERFLLRAGQTLATSGPTDAIDLFFTSDLAPLDLAALRAEVDPDGMAIVELAAADAPPPPPMLRVRQDRIDAVIELEAGLRAATAALVDALAEPGAAQALDELNVLQRSLPARAAARIGSILERLRAAKAEAARAGQRLALGLSQLDEAVLELRVVPFGQVAARLPRVLRGLSEQEGKPAELLVTGEEVTLDRSVADLLADPLLHLIRNAMDHGIEPPDQRTAAGKPPVARLVLEAERRPGRLRVSFADDGRGIDPAAILARARARGLVDPGATPDADQLSALLFLPGFSTRDTVSATSGRGVGLDVVQEAVRRAGGTVELSSTPGRGTRFTLELPLNAAIQPVLLVEAGGHAYALPAGRVEAVLGPGEVREGQRVISLDAVLQLPPSRPGAVVLLRRPAGLLGLAVWRVGRRTDLLLKPLHPELAATPGVGGAGLLGNGEAVLLLEPDGLG